jgi:hypothetical protein
MTIIRESDDPFDRDPSKRVRSFGTFAVPSPVHPSYVPPPRQEKREVETAAVMCGSVPLTGYSLGPAAASPSCFSAGPVGRYHTLHHFHGRALSDLQLPCQLGWKIGCFIAG